MKEWVVPNETNSKTHPFILYMLSSVTLIYNKLFNLTELNAVTIDEALLPLASNLGPPSSIHGLSVISMSFRRYKAAGL